MESLVRDSFVIRRLRRLRRWNLGRRQTSGAFGGDPQSPEATKDCAEDWEDYAEAAEGFFCYPQIAQITQMEVGEKPVPQSPRASGAGGKESGARSQNAEGKLLDPVPPGRRDCGAQGKGE